MQSYIEDTEIERIALKVVELLKPLLGNKEKAEDKIYTPESLAIYLKINTSWIYKKVSLRKIPFFKMGKYLRFRKSDIDTWHKSLTQRPVTPLTLMKKKRLDTL